MQSLRIQRCFYVFYYVTEEDLKFASVCPHEDTIKLFALVKSG